MSALCCTVDGCYPTTGLVLGRLYLDHLELDLNSGCPT